MSGWRKKKSGWLKIQHRQKRMQKWISKYGPPCDINDKKQEEEWLSQNKITICPPFGHKPKGD
tara:strand:- start:793 stop:981 length:189 start_codon:yes stop_codon:yes gene_type:complete